MTRDDLDVERILAETNSPAQIRATRAETIALCKRVLALEAALRALTTAYDVRRAQPRGAVDWAGDACGSGVGKAWSDALRVLEGDE